MGTGYVYELLWKSYWGLYMAMLNCYGKLINEIN